MSVCAKYKESYNTDDFSVYGNKFSLHSSELSYIVCHVTIKIK